MRCLLAIFLCIAPLLMAQTPDANSARIFITDSQSWSIAGGGGTDQSSPEARAPQTAEIIKTFGQRCPQVVTNTYKSRPTSWFCLITRAVKALFATRTKW